MKLKNLYLYLVNPKFSFLNVNICSTLVPPSSPRSSGFYHEISRISQSHEIYRQCTEIVQQPDSLLLTYTEQCLWDSSWHSHKGQDLGLIKQLRLLWQHILASVVSLWIFLFFNCFFSTRCWPWLPHSAPAIGFSFLMVSQAFALGNWPEFFSSSQPLSPRLTVASICWHLIMTESMPSDRIWPSSVALLQSWPGYGLTVTSPQSVMVLFGLNCLWCSSSGCGLLLFPAYFVGRKDRPMEELSLWNISVFWMASLCQLISSN